ncbi:MAG: helix-turn-helix domain-containing protein [Spirochaetaceae bacterium]|jgi:addiction module HigA family antidote|nr:helix-turn-helix domain-containing protein [Spirochaetaceae bacterium]
MKKGVEAKGGAVGKTPAIELQRQINQFGLSKNAVAKAVGISPITLNHVLTGDKKVDIELSLLFGKYFGTGEALWIDLQRKTGLTEAKKKLAVQLKELKKATPVKEDKKNTGWGTGAGSQKAAKTGVKKTAPKKGAKTGPKKGARKTAQTSSPAASTQSTIF